MQRQNQLRQELKGYIEDYLRQKGLSLRKPFRCLSPEHEDKHPSMSYYPRGQYVHCFSCGATYDIFHLIRLDYGLDAFSDQMRKACELFGLDGGELPSAATPAQRPPTRPEVSDRKEVLEALRTEAGESLDYFLSRGVHMESCRAYGLFQRGDRAYFPVLEGGVCTGWCARAMDDGKQPRYRNSPGAMGIWNGDLLRQPGGGRRLFITEGVLDAICIEQLGERAVALCGSQNTGKLLTRCAENPQALGGWNFVACGDPDAAGEKMNETLKEGLERLGGICETLSLDAADGDIAALYQAAPQRLRALLAADPVNDNEYSSSSAAAALDAFFADAERRSSKGAMSTGFAGLDRVLDGGLYSGLYIIGAISSLGKTGFVLQIADYIAEKCADVLFFSLEQSKFELMARSLSRTSAQLDGTSKRDAFTVRQLLGGGAGSDPRRRRLLLDSREAYARAAAGLFLREGLADIGTEEIRAAVRQHLQDRGKPPVVVVDYLQILRPADPRATDKQNTDRAVIELKRISRDFDIPVVAISSFNRENYRAAVSMEAFKESGAVEYSSDVLIGLQLQGAGSRDFDVNAEKARDPRRVELVMLKNRNGIPYARVPLRFYGKFGFFEEA